MSVFEEIQSLTVPFKENELHWRFEEEDDRIPYEEHESQIQPLSNEGAKLLSGLVSDSGIHDDFPFQKNRYLSIEQLDLDPVAFQDEFKRIETDVKKWFYELSIAFDRTVFVSYDSSHGYVMPWKMFVKYWRNIYYSISDDVTVLDDSMTWCLLLFHEDQFFFGTDRERNSAGRNQ